jgi:hypothetical protein
MRFVETSKENLALWLACVAHWSPVFWRRSSAMGARHASAHHSPSLSGTVSESHDDE